MNREIVGLRCEIVGLVVVLIATIWQGTFTDWFDKISRDWIAATQESVNLSLLYALNDLSRQVNEADPEKRQKIRMEIYDRVSAATTEAIRDRERRTALEKGQATIFSTTRYAMLLIGAALIVGGKWLVLTHKRKTSN